MSLDNNFKYHAPTQEKIAKHELVRSTFQDAAEGMKITLPQGREAAIVQTKIEEAMFWANAAIARELEIPAPTYLEN